MSKIYEKYRDLITNPFDIKYKKMFKKIYWCDIIKKQN